MYGIKTGYYKTNNSSNDMRSFWYKPISYNKIKVVFSDLKITDVIVLNDELFSIVDKTASTSRLFGREAFDLELIKK